MEKLYVLAGKARCGKDSVANIIEKYYSNKKVTKLMYGQWVKDYASMIYDWDGSEEDKPRTLLQDISIKSRSVNPGYTIRRMEEDINILKDYFDIFIITDARMPEEVTMPKEKFNAITIKIERPNYESALTKKEQRHPTETALDHYDNYDYKIINDSTLDDLEKKTIDLLESEGK